MRLEPGKRFGRLVVQRHAGSRWWICRCSCGISRRVRADHLTLGITVSCGCRRRTARLRHGHTRNGRPTSTYRSWRTMLDRCTNPRVPGYRFYGGRGIRVCRRWRRFDAFVADMGERPAGTSLDRKRPRGHYTPKNCRWASRSVQANNTRRSIHLRWHGQRLSVSEWARRLGVPKATIYYRVRAGWTTDRVLGEVA